MNRDKKIGLAVMVLVFLFSTLPLYAQGPEDAPSQEVPKDKKGGPEKLFEELGLTQEQKDQLKAAREEEGAKVKPLREQVRVKREELRKVFEGAAIDKAQAYALSDAITSLEDELMHLRVDNIISLKQILTPDQFKKMQEKIKKRHAEMGRKMKEGRGPKRD
jgi:Spy/CpxP family protein refolding chaperone